MKSKSYIKIIFFFLVITNFYGQKKEIDSLQRVLLVAKSDTAKVSIYNNLANQYKEYNPDSTVVYAQKAKELSLKIKHNFGLANAFMNYGNANIIKGNYKLAQQNFEKAKNYFNDLLKNDSKNKQLINGLARTYASLGVIFSENSDYADALANYQKALQLYIEINQKNSISKAFNNIGVVYKSQNNKPKALEYFKKALQIQEEIGEQTVPVTQTNIGALLFEQEKFDKAFYYYMLAKKGFEKIDNQRGMALLYNYLGDYYKKQKNTNKAIESYNKSIQISEAIQNKFGGALALYNLGIVYKDQKNYTEAMRLSTKSLLYAKEIEVLDQVYHSEKLVSELYELQGNEAQSLVHYKNYIVARDSINNFENNKKFLEAEMNFEYQKKEALLIETNKRKNQLILFSILGILLALGLVFLIFNRRQVKRRLTLQKEVAEYEQKALHLQMNPHFVFNCLGSISSFIVQNGTDSALKYLSKFSKLMRLTLEYSKDSLIPIDKEVESLQNYLELEQLRFHDSFTFKILTSDKVEFNMGLPPLLIQPFVENAILHGLVPKEGKGTINVTFDVQNEKLVCTIVDDGIGISNSKAMKENSVTAHQSMALEITKKRLEIMEATIAKSAQIEIKEENGTVVTLRLPIQYIK